MDNGDGSYTQNEVLGSPTLENRLQLLPDDLLIPSSTLVSFDVVDLPSGDLSLLERVLLSFSAQQVAPYNASVRSNPYSVTFGESSFFGATGLDLNLTGSGNLMTFPITINNIRLYPGAGSLSTEVQGEQL